MLQILGCHTFANIPEASFSYWKLPARTMWITRTA
uniref:Uncharacterized protein n=1 Tax=Anguilla anguilla TaxID=7936 RepID=A0A0E9R0M8_ANGAN